MDKSILIDFTKKFYLTYKEFKVIICLINDYQWDKAQWTIDGVDLTKLKKKIQERYIKNV